MDALELWDLAFLALVIMLVGVALRRRPRLNEDEVTLEDLARQIKFQWPIAGSFMVFALYVSFHVFVARVDAIDTLIFLSFLVALCIIKCLLAVRRIVKLSQQQRVLATSLSQSPEGDMSE